MIKKNRFAVKVFISQPFRILISLTRDKTGRDKRQDTRGQDRERSTGRDILNNHNYVVPGLSSNSASSSALPLSQFMLYNIKHD